MRKVWTLAMLAVVALAWMAVGGAAASAEQPWGFEQVTPPDKGGGTVATIGSFQTSPDGNAFLYSTTLPFDSVPAAGAPIFVRYLATRTADGWQNRSPEVPYSTGLGAGTSLFHAGSVLGTSVDLSHAVVVSRHALTPGATENGGNLYMEDTSTGALTLVATSPDRRLANTSLQSELNVKYVGNDGSFLFAGTTAPLIPGAPDQGPTGQTVAYGWSPAGGLRAMTVLPESEGGAIVAGATAGNGLEYGVRNSMAYSDGLAHVYFTESLAIGKLGPIYVRSGDVTTLVSVSHIAGDTQGPVEALGDAVSDGGRYLLFHTRKNTPLTSDTPVATGQTNTYLYRYSVAADPEDALTYIGTIGGNNGAIQMTQDGQTVAFQTTLALDGEGVAGQQNMFVWRHGQLRFVETADPGSTAGSDGHAFRRVLSTDGRYLAFSDNSSSVAAQFGFDNTSVHCPTVVGAPGPCKEIYLFDADAASGGLSCVSCRTDGKAPQGNAGDGTTSPGDILLNSHQAQTVANDGTVFFSAADDLLPQDSNGNRDVYASHDGHLRLVSRGAQGTSARFLDATPDGKTVFFSTNDPIVPTDTDREVDIYVTREGAGFPYSAPVTPAPCVGDECRNAFTAPVLPGTPASTTFSGSGNVTGHGVAAPSERVRVVGSRTIHGARGRLRVRVPASGRLTVSGRAVRRMARSVPTAGTSPVTVRLSKRAARTLRVRHRRAAAAWRRPMHAHRLTAKMRRTLRRRARVHAVVTVRFAPTTGVSSAARVRVVFAASLTKKGR